MRILLGLRLSALFGKRLVAHLTLFDRHFPIEWSGAFRWILRADTTFARSCDSLLSFAFSMRLARLLISLSVSEIFLDVRSVLDGHRLIEEHLFAAIPVRLAGVLRAVVEQFVFVIQPV